MKSEILNMNHEKSRSLPWSLSCSLSPVDAFLLFCRGSRGRAKSPSPGRQVKKARRLYEARDTGHDTRIIPNKPNSPIVQTNVRAFTKMIYTIFASLTKVKNKPNSNPNKPNIKTIWALSKPIQSQIKANNQSLFGRPNLLSIFNHPSLSVLTFCSGVLNSVFSLTSYLINDKIYNLDNTG
jgi:hypothetical protein